MSTATDAASRPTGPGDEESPDVVQRLVSQVAREQAEPRDGFEPVPFWVACIFGALLAWGGYYIGTNSADFRADVFDRSDLRTAAARTVAAPPPDPDPQTLDELMKIGQQKYGVCANCHKIDGKGDPAQKIPPLAGSDWVDGPQASAARLSRILLYGLTGPITVNGVTYNHSGTAMPAQGNVMKDYEIAAVITYIRNSWGNQADKGKSPAVTAAVVRAARAKEGNRKTNGSQPVTADELLKLPVDYSDLSPPPSPTDGAKDKK